MNLEKFHSEENGCVLEEKIIQQKNPWVSSKKYFCVKHGVKICRCGWEFGWHGGIHYLTLESKEKINTNIILPINQHGQTNNNI